MKRDEDIRLLYIDLFCGAGGTSTGVENAVYDGKKIAKVIACVNHDKNAIASHKANHPDAIHYTEDIRTLELGPMVKHVEMARKTYPNAKVVLWASLECTNFSKAKGGQSRDADSRTLAEHLFRYVEAIRPDAIQIENVEEFMTWGPLVEKRRKDGSIVMTKKSSGKGKDKTSWEEPAMIPDPEHSGEYYYKWVNDMCSYGYTYDHRILNSADFGAYTSRKRFFAMFAGPGVPMVFPVPTHAKNPEMNLFGECLQPWKPVREVLDLKDEGSSIWDRKKPLVEATLKRILAGLHKFVGDGTPAFLTKAFSGDPSGKQTSIDAPAGTVTTSDHHQFITAYYGNGGAHSVNLPAPTVTTKDRLAMVYLDNQYGNGKPTSVNDPCGTIMINPKQKPVFVKQSPWLMQTNYDNVGQSIDVPAKVITADRHWAYILNPQYDSKGGCIDTPAPTVIARQDKAPLQLVSASGELRRVPSFVHQAEDGRLYYEILPTDNKTVCDIKEFMCAHGIVDISMRMLRIKELKLIQGFPEDYILCGTQEEQKKYLGNAVVTIMAKVWCEAIVDRFHKDSKTAKAS